jgi:serine/threonine-protein kinase ATR
MTDQLLEVCNFKVDEHTKALSIAKSFKDLRVLGNCDLVIPLQTSLTVNLPSSSSAEGLHQPFPVDAPTFKGAAATTSSVLPRY